MKHLELNNILSDSQHGFRAKRSTETQLIQTIHDISKSLDKETVDMAILDFTKAFHKVPHKRLIHEINYYGIYGCIATWIEPFLIGRSQQVVVNKWGSIIIYNSYLRCTTGNCSWAANCPSLHKPPTRQPIYKCTALCRLLYFIYTYQNTKLRRCLVPSPGGERRRAVRVASTHTT